MTPFVGAQFDPRSMNLNGLMNLNDQECKTSILYLMSLLIPYNNTVLCNSKLYRTLVKII